MKLQFPKSEGLAEIIKSTDQLRICKRDHNILWQLSGRKNHYRWI